MSFSFMSQCKAASFGYEVFFKSQLPIQMRCLSAVTDVSVIKYPSNSCVNISYKNMC